MSKLADILYSIQKRPPLWFGRAGTIRDISAFITGFQHGQSDSSDEFSFEYFTRWVAAHYRVEDGPMGSFTLILEHVGGDEHRAFEEFFRLLPLYERDLAELGGAEIHAHYGRVMAEIRHEGGQREGA